MFTLFINDDLNDKTENKLIQLAHIPKWEGMKTLLKDRSRIQNDFDKLEKLSEINKMRFNDSKCKALHLEIIRYTCTKWRITG